MRTATIATPFAITRFDDESVHLVVHNLLMTRRLLSRCG
jgi:hypothetical protein